MTVVQQLRACTEFTAAFTVLYTWYSTWHTDKIWIWRPTIMYKGETEQDTAMGLLYHIHVSPNLPTYQASTYKPDIHITLNCSRTFSDSINTIKCPIKSHDQIISLKYSKLHTSWSTNSTSEHWDLTQQNKNTYIVYEVFILLRMIPTPL